MEYFILKPDKDTQDNTLSEYVCKKKINVKNIFEYKSGVSKLTGEKHLLKILNSILSKTTLIISNLSVFGSTIDKIIEMINKVLERDIIIQCVEKELSFSSNNQELKNIIHILFNLSQEKKRKQLQRAKDTREKSNKKIGRKSGKKTKSIFDPYRNKILKLYKIGLSNVKILETIKKSDPRLQDSSTQALGQYIKKLNLKSNNINNEGKKFMMDRHI